MPNTSTRARKSSRRAWLLVAGLAALGFTVLGPLDELGRSGDLTAHVAQHLLLGDIVAPLLLLGLPLSVRAQLASALSRHRLLRTLTSPPVALALWAVVTTAWYLPAAHRAAAPGGLVHVLDHASFVAFGLLVWLAVFDVRRARPLGEAVWHGGLPWWGRHLYAIGSRPLLLPASLIVWFAPGYRSGDQVNAATLLIGVEMFLFLIALVAAFIALAVHEGRRIDDERS